MDGRGIAWVSYIPIPGLALVPPFVWREDRLTRYHAWQGGTLVIGLYTTIALLGLVGRLVDADWWRTLWGLLVGLLLVAGIIGMVVGTVGALQGRHVRVRPAWDMLRIVGK